MSWIDLYTATGYKQHFLNHVSFSLFQLPLKQLAELISQMTFYKLMIYSCKLIEMHSKHILI